MDFFLFCTNNFEQAVGYERQIYLHLSTSCCYNLVFAIITLHADLLRVADCIFTFMLLRCLLFFFFFKSGALQDVLHLHDVLARVSLARLCHSISRARALDGEFVDKSCYSLYMPTRMTIDLVIEIISLQNGPI